MTNVHWKWLAGILGVVLVGIAAWQLAQLWRSTPALMPPPYSMAVLPPSSGGASEEQIADRLTRDLSSTLGRVFRYGRVEGEANTKVFACVPQ
jgi:hypothetical protein